MEIQEVNEPIAEDSTDNVRADNDSAHRRLSDYNSGFVGGIHD